MLNFSKSKYTGLCQCTKLAWLNKYKSEEKVIDPALAGRLEAGSVIGDLAMGLFGDFVEVTVTREDGKLDLEEMAHRTQEEMARGTEVICEASFFFGGLYCAVDILKREGGGWAIYEVKSSSADSEHAEKAEKEVYLQDVAFQKYVLEHCGVNVTGTNLVVLNKAYRRHGDLDIQALFLTVDVSEAVAERIGNVEPMLEAAERVLASPEEPTIDLGVHCSRPYRCAFWKYCSRHLPQPSVFDLNGTYTKWNTKLKLYYQGKVGFEVLEDCGDIKSPISIRHIRHTLHDLPDHIDKEGIRAFLDTLSYPIYFLDFETFQTPVPLYDDSGPYAQIPFQYSLHFIEEAGGEVRHAEYLAPSKGDPRRYIAEALCKDIPMNVCVTAYNKNFECTRLKELAELFPDLAEQLMNIRENIRDFWEPFKNGYYYNRAMGGSFSIKSVLPALYPDDPELDYHNLPGVQNGGEAMNIFPRLKDMTPEEEARQRDGLLQYCGLDTFALVKVWEKLKEAAQ